MLLSKPFDPYPFILLNLAFSTQAAYAAPLILLAGNRAALRDRMTLEHAAAEADLEDAQNRRLLEGNVEILRRVEGLEARILELEASILAAIDTRSPAPPGLVPTTRRRPGRAETRRAVDARRTRRRSGFARRFRGRR